MAPLAALLLATSPVQVGEPLDDFETVCVSSAAEMGAADESATASGWTWFEDPEPDPEGDFFENYGRKGDARAKLVIGLTGEDITVASCTMTSETDFEALVQAVDNRLGFEAQAAFGETKLAWIFTRDGNRMTALAGVTDLPGVMAAVRPGTPVQVITVDALMNTDNAIRTLTYERFIDLSQEASSSGAPKR